MLTCTAGVETLALNLARVNPDKAKARKAIPMPLDGEAVSILHKQIGKQTDCRGTKRGNPSNCRGNLVGPERLERSTYGLRVLVGLGISL